LTDLAIGQINFIPTYLRFTLPHFQGAHSAYRYTELLKGGKEGAGRVRGMGWQEMPRYQSIKILR